MHPEPELVVDADEAVTCSRCRAKIVVALDHAGRAAWHTEWLRLEAAVRCVGRRGMTDLGYGPLVMPVWAWTLIAGGAIRIVA